MYVTFKSYVDNIHVHVHVDREHTSVTPLTTNACIQTTCTCTCIYALYIVHTVYMYMYMIRMFVWVQGIVKALAEFRHQLLENNVKIFVRRGGPNYQEGLRVMREVGEYE